MVEGACPFVSCRHHLLLDVTDIGSIKSPGMPAFSLRDKEGFAQWAERVVDNIADAEHTCSLDAADERARGLEAVGELMGVSRQRIQQLERSGADAFRGAMPEDMPAAFRELKHGHPSPLALAERDGTGYPYRRELRAGIARLEGHKQAYAEAERALQVPRTTREGAS